MTTEKVFSTLDIYLATWLHIHNIPPQLEINNNRVLFFFPSTDQVYRIVSEFNSNNSAPILDYVTAYKELRHRMLAARGQGAR